MIDKDRFQTSLPKGNYDKVEFTAGSNCDPNGENCATLYFDVVGPCDGVVSRDGDAIVITCGPPTKLILCAPGLLFVSILRLRPIALFLIRGPSSAINSGNRFGDYPEPWLRNRTLRHIIAGATDGTQGVMRVVVAQDQLGIFI